MFIDYNIFIKMIYNEYNIFTPNIGRVSSGQGKLASIALYCGCSVSVGPYVFV